MNSILMIYLPCLVLFVVCSLYCFYKMGEEASDRRHRETIRFLRAKIDIYETSMKEALQIIRDHEAVQDVIDEFSHEDCANIGEVS